MKKFSKKILSLMLCLCMTFTLGAGMITSVYAGTITKPLESVPTLHSVAFETSEDTVTVDGTTPATVELRMKYIGEEEVFQVASVEGIFSTDIPNVTNANYGGPVNDPTLLGDLSVVGLKNKFVYVSAATEGAGMGETLTPGLVFVRDTLTIPADTPTGDYNLTLDWAGMCELDIVYGDFRYTGDDPDYYELGEMYTDLETITIPIHVTNTCTHVNATSTAAVKATCTANGSIAYWSCNGCNKYFADNAGAIDIDDEITLADTVVAAKGHDWGAWTATTPAGCTVGGTETRVCTRDATHIETRDIAATGHAWGEWTATTPAGCTVGGVETRVCHNDPTHVETRAIPAKRHKYNEQTDICEYCKEPRNTTTLSYKIKLFDVNTNEEITSASAVKRGQELKALVFLTNNDIEDDTKLELSSLGLTLGLSTESKNKGITISAISKMNNSLVCNLNVREENPFITMNYFIGENGEPISLNKTTTIASFNITFLDESDSENLFIMSSRSATAVDSTEYIIQGEPLIIKVKPQFESNIVSYQLNADYTNISVTTTAINNISTSKSALAVAAAYDDNGKMIGIASKVIEMDKHETRDDFWNISLQKYNGNLKPNLNLKYFLLDYTDSRLPLCEAANISCS